MQRLADQMRKSISTMTRVVGNLVDRGHVRREVDSADGRVVRVSLTPQGTAVVEAIHRELLAAE
jgi:DNA-binding MarR family transcriptional regulator